MTYDDFHLALKEAADLVPPEHPMHERLVNLATEALTLSSRLRKAEQEHEAFCAAVNRLLVRDEMRRGFFLADEAIVSCDRDVFKALTR